MAADTPAPDDVRVTSPDKVLFPDAGYTKADLIDHYKSLADLIVPHVHDRPVSLQSFPAGIGKSGHFLKEVPKGFPKWVERFTVPKHGGTVTHPLANNASTLVQFAQYNAITFHVWTSRVDMLDRPDRLVIDLDPDDGNTFDDVRSAARLVGELFESIGLTPFAMTTGSRGVHVVAPLRRELDFEGIGELASGIAAAAVAARPDELTTEFSKVKREGRLYIDTLRNRFAQTVPAVYAVRPLPEASVATPLRWEELSDATLSPRQWTIKTIRDRLAHGGCPWRDMTDATADPRAARNRLASL